MKKIAIILLGVFAFACGSAENNVETSTQSTTTREESVEIGSGNEVSPQLEPASDSSNALAVDTVSSATEITQRP